MIGPKPEKTGYAEKKASIRLSKETVHLDCYAYTTKPDSQQHWKVSALLPPGERDGAIVVGGGGWADWHTRGAFLTASCPTEGLDGWFVASKDHAGEGEAHQLSVYLLALRIDGMRRDDLVRLVQIFEAQSASEEHPTAEVVVPASHTVLSGGFWVDWRGAGNLATASRPNAAQNGWIAKSKDHGANYADSAIIHAYAIGIKNILPGAVSVEPHIDKAESSATGWPTMEVPLDPAYLLTGAGAEVNWHGFGNMLTRIEPIVYVPSKPALQGVGASAKDHLESDPSTVTVYAVGARLPDTTFNIDGTFNADHLAWYVRTLTQAGV